MSPPAGRFGRSERLLHSRDFQRVARCGIRVASPDFVLLVAPARAVSAVPAREPSRRLGVTASRKLGRAVVRNRVKRRIREWFRCFREEFEEGVDIVVIARPGAATLAGREICEQLRKLGQRAGSVHRRRSAGSGGEVHG